MTQLELQFEPPELSDLDKARLNLIQALRHAADRATVVRLFLPPTAARMLAYDLEELGMLKHVPPTGAKG